MDINGQKIGYGTPAYIIAEIGVNHNGRVDLALEMIECAASAGVDAVKFQIVTAERCYAQSSASYELFKKVEMKKVEWRRLIDYCRDHGVDFFATFADIQDLRDYAEFNLPAIKISSTNLTNFPLLKAIAEDNKPVIMSTGLSYLSEIKEAVRFLKEKGQNQMAILQCTSLYPTEAQNVNLSTMDTLRDSFPDCPIGFSDHTLGIYCAIAAIARGAAIIEKHFTLDKNMPGSDHHFSASPEELREMVKAIREVERAIGSNEKQPVSDELPLRAQWMRSLVAVKDIQEGQIITDDIIGIKRSTPRGLEPKYLETVLGKKATKAILKDEPITQEVIGKAQ